MKTIKSLITLLLLTITATVQAQTVVIEMTDGTSDEYELSDIDSIAYEPVDVSSNTSATATSSTNKNVLVVQGANSSTRLNVKDEPSMTIGDNIVVTSGTTSLSYDLASRLVLKALSNDGDVNNDGKVDIQDVSTLVKKILNKE